MRKRVVIAMSGGIDSSVAAYLMKQKGYDCIGMYLHFWSDPKISEDEEDGQFPQNKCCSEDSLERARRIAHMLSMPFYVKDVQDIFKEKIVDDFLEKHKKALTPNPCVECNRNVKFGILLQSALSLGADYLATGHYARIRKRKEKYSLLMALDKEKDQSYFLYTLSQNKLKHVLFPIGQYNKKKVRQIAKISNLEPVIDQRESQGICFFPDKKHTDFLKRHLEKDEYSKGPIKTLDGEIIGSHQGLPFYTIGQRKGLRIGGEMSPYYVIALSKEDNAIIVGKEEDLKKEKLKAIHLHFINPPDGNEVKVYARIRHRFEPKKGLLKLNGEIGELIFEEPQRAITKGQSVVFYLPDKKDKKPEAVLGGGIIA